METQNWWKEDFEKKHWGAMFECGDYEALLDDVSAIIAEAIRRRDAYLLEKVEGMAEIKESPDYSAHQYNAGYRQAAFDVIKLIKGE